MSDLARGIDLRLRDCARRVAPSSRALSVPLLGVGLAALVLAVPEHAKAWTEAQVQSAQAVVDVDAEGRLRARMTVSLHVHGGWLEGLDISGLDAELALDPDVPLTFVSSEGRAYEPRISPREEGVRLEFRRRNAPRRGDYEMTFGYRATLAQPLVRPDPRREGWTRYEWIFPGWRSGLDDVRIEVLAPSEAILADELHGDHTLLSQEREVAEDGRARLVFQRAHLPRTVPWSLAFSLPNDVVPASRLAPVPEAVAPLSPQVVAAARERGPHPAALAYFVLFAVVALLKLVLHRRAARARSVTLRPLIPLPFALRVLGLLALVAAAAFAWHVRTDAGLATLLLAIVLLLDRAPPVPEASPQEGSYAPVRREDRLWAAGRAQLARMGVARWLDASTLPGLGVLVACVALVAFVDRAWGGDPIPPGYATLLHAIVPFAAMMLTLTRAQLPSTLAERLHALQSLAGRLPADLSSVPIGYQLALHRATGGRGQDARLRLCTEFRVEGLRRLDLAIADRPVAGAFRREGVVLVVVDEGSAADRALEVAFPRHPSQGGATPRGSDDASTVHLRARTFPLSHLRRVVEAVAVELPEGEVASSGSMGSALSTVRLSASATG